MEAEWTPNRERWEAQHCVDRSFWAKAGEIGLLCASVPTEWGGGGATFLHEAVIVEEQARALATAWGNQVHSGIVARYILEYADDHQRAEWLPKMARGELLGAIAMSEPAMGSDLQAMTTRAERIGSEYVLNGSKSFITNGRVAQLIIVAAKTNSAARAHGISLIVVESNKVDGLSRGEPMNKIGMNAQDTCEIYLDNVRVPAANLLGQIEGEGFGQLMAQLVQERLIIAIQAVASVERALGETIEYVRNRQVFGQPLLALQNTRFRLAECKTAWMVTRTFLDECIVRHSKGELDAATAAMAKWWCTDLQGSVVDECLQLHGGYGYSKEYPIATLFVDGRVQRIYAGSNEIMKEVIARGL